MKLLVLALLLSPSLLSAKDYKTFKRLHTYNRNDKFDCTVFMNRVLKPLGLPCRPVNTVILGDEEDFTNIQEVINICNGEGIPLGGSRFQSKKSFRTAKCRQVGSGGFPDNCEYRRQNVTKAVVVGCSKYLPVHLDE